MLRVTPDVRQHTHIATESTNRYTLVHRHLHITLQGTTPLKPPKERHRTPERSLSNFLKPYDQLRGSLWQRTPSSSHVAVPRAREMAGGHQTLCHAYGGDTPYLTKPRPAPRPNTRYDTPNGKKVLKLQPTIIFR